MSDYQMLTGDDGEPLGFIDVETLVTEGQQLAYRMAANCADHRPADHLELFTKLGQDAFTLVMIRALDYMARMLDLVFVTTDAAGLCLRSDIQALVSELIAGEPPTHEPPANPAGPTS